MKLYADYHTHTIYSHGKGTVLSNALVAKEKGLSELGITDHGFNHMLYAVSRKKLPALKSDILSATEQTGVKIYLGVEANIISRNGDVDVRPEDFEYIDLLIVGFHKCVWTDIKSLFNFNIKNILTKNASKKLIQYNTEAYIRALRRYPIDIISHLNDCASVDVVAVAKVASEVGCYIELNGKREHFSEKQVRDLVEQTDVMFVMSSDAHRSETVGEVPLWEGLVQKYGIPAERIANLNQGIKVRDKRGFYGK